MKATVPDAEFIELWRTHKSATDIQRILDIDIRAVHLRRRRMERKYNITLNAQGSMAQHYVHLSPEEHGARKHFSVENGVVIVWSDAHFWPKLRTTAFKALLMFIRELKPKLLIANGDMFDGSSISRYPRIGWDSKPTVIEELKACQERLGEIEEISVGVKKVWCVGNHDSRFSTRLAANVPEYQGVEGFRLKDHFPEWIPSWSAWINDDVVVKHRYKGGIHATHNNTVNSGKTIVTGHLHSLKVTPFDDYRGTRWGVDTGTLADANGPQFVDYSEDGPKNHRSGFAVLTFVDGELLDPELCRVRKNGEVIFRGCVIDVSKE